MISRKPSFWVVLGVAIMDTGAAIIALPWLVAATFGVWGARFPMGYFIFALIAAFTALADFIILWSSTRVAPRGSS